MTRHRRRAQRRAESRLFEAIEAADAGQLRLAEELLARAVTPRRARATIIATELASLAVLESAPGSPTLPIE